jgi:tetratricopeptide (TPR) repeat protein
LRKATKLDPKFVQAQYQLGQVLMQRGDYEGAGDRFAWVVNLDPNNVDAYRQLGAARTKSRQYQQAVVALEKGLSLQPNDALSRYNLGVALQEQKKYPEAIAQYQQAILLDPNMSEAFYSLGVSLEQSQRREEAVSFLLQARNLYRQAGNQQKVDEVNLYVQQLTTPPPTVPAVVQPPQSQGVQPATPPVQQTPLFQPAPSNPFRTTPLNNGRPLPTPSNTGGNGGTR